MMLKRKGSILNLISQSQHNPSQFTIHQSTINYIKQTSTGPYAFVSICGDYRSGKSFLLNQLFNQQVNFQTSSSTQPCTQGIKMWSEPLKKNGIHIWVLDTEGFGSVHRDSHYDAKIFLFTLLVSNFVLYNSFGAIDEANIEKLALACKLAQQIDVCTSQTQLFWLLRDFSLEMVDINGQSLSGDQYLSYVLEESSFPHLREQKLMIKTLFLKRHCIPLVRPLTSEKQLNSFGDIKFALRQQFSNQIENLREAIFNLAKPKKVNNVELCNENIFLIFNEFANLLNSQKLEFTYLNTYDRIISHQKQLIKQAISKFFAQKQASFANQLPSLQLFQHLKIQFYAFYDNLKQRYDWNDGRNQNEKYWKGVRFEAEQELQFLCSKIKDNLQIEVRQKMHHSFFSSIPKILNLDLSQFQNGYLEIQSYSSSIISQYVQEYNFLPNINKEMASWQAQILIEQEKKVFFELIKKWRKREKQLEIKYVNAEQKRKVLQKQKSEMIAEYQFKLNQFDHKHSEDLQLSKNHYQALIHDYQQSINQQKQKLRELSSKIQSMNDSKEQQITRLFSELGKQKQNISQIRNNYENRIKILQIKNSQLQSFLNNQRKKYQEFMDIKKDEQRQLLEDIAIKNEKILNLKRENVEIQNICKINYQKFIKEKESLIKQIADRSYQYESKQRIYEAKVQSFLARIQELEKVENINEELELEIRLMKQSLEQVEDLMRSEQSYLKKLESSLQDKQSQIIKIKIESEKKLKENEDEVKQRKIYLEEEQERVKQQVEYLKNKYQTEMNLLISKFQEQIKNNQQLNNKMIQQVYSSKEGLLENLKQTQKRELELLQDNRDIFKNLQNIDAILSKKNQDIQKQIAIFPEVSQFFIQNGAVSKNNGTDITQNVIQSIQNAINTLHKAYDICFNNLQKRDLQIKNISIQALSYEQLATKTCQENKKLFQILSIQESKNLQLQQISAKYFNEKQRNNQMEEECHILKQELRQNQILETNRQKSLENNLALYKQTIQNLTDENQLLINQNKALLEANRALTEGPLRQIKNHNQTKSQTSIKAIYCSSESEKKGVSIDQQIQKLKEENKILQQTISQMKIHELQLRQQKIDMSQKIVEIQQEKYNKLMASYKELEQMTKKIESQYNQKIQVMLIQQKRYKDHYEAKYTSDVLKNQKKERTFQVRFEEQKSMYDREIENLRQKLKINQTEIQIMTKGKQDQMKKLREELFFERDQQKVEKQKQKLKYEHLLKVNNQLIKEVEIYKGRLNEKTIKETYQQKIVKLFGA